MTSEVKNRKKQRESAKPSFKPAEFINHTFSVDDKARFKAYVAEHGEEIWELVDRLLESGYSIAIKPDPYNEAYAAYLQTSNDEDDNHGFILSGRSRSGFMALWAVVYRHYCLFEGQWPTEGSRRTHMDDE